MASSPGLKIYNPAGEYIASCKHAEEAGCLMAFLGDGAEIRMGHQRAVWTEGAETQSAGESYDFVASTVAARIAGVWAAHAAKSLAR